MKLNLMELPTRPLTGTLSELPGNSEGATRATLQRMGELATAARADPTIILFARRLVQGLSQKDYAGEVLRLFDFVQHQIRYVRDPLDLETVATPLETLTRQAAGDCDDKVTLLMALLFAIGHPARFVAGGFSAGAYVHVYLEAFARGEWIALDPTEEHPAGWRPMLPVELEYTPPPAVNAAGDVSGLPVLRSQVVNAPWLSQTALTTNPVPIAPSSTAPPVVAVSAAADVQGGSVPQVGGVAVDPGLLLFNKAPTEYEWSLDGVGASPVYLSRNRARLRADLRDVVDRYEAALATPVDASGASDTNIILPLDADLFRQWMWEPVWYPALAQVGYNNPMDWPHVNSSEDWLALYQYDARWLVSNPSTSVPSPRFGFDVATAKVFLNLPHDVALSLMPVPGHSSAFFSYSTISEAWSEFADIMRGPGTIVVIAATAGAASAAAAGEGAAADAAAADVATAADFSDVADLSDVIGSGFVDAAPDFVVDIAPADSVAAGTEAIGTGVVDSAPAASADLLGGGSVPADSVAAGTEAIGTGVVDSASATSAADLLGGAQSVIKVASGVAAVNRAMTPPPASSHALLTGAAAPAAPPPSTGVSPWWIVGGLLLLKTIAAAS